MAQSQSQSSAHKNEKTLYAAENVQAATKPKKGEMYRCTECGMELEITSDCKCPDSDMIKLECCGQQLLRM